MKWQHVEYLFGLAALPILGAMLYFFIRWKKKTKARIGDPRLVRELVRSHSQLKFGIKAGLVLLAFAVIVLGAANLQAPGKMENVNRRGVDVIMALDVSKSMLARDIQPSRLEKAKQLLTRLSDKLESDRIGLVLFAGRAYLQMPLTTDHGAARMYIHDASPDVVPTQGTVIGEALKMANTSFNSKDRKYKAIVLISDGEDHDPEALTVAKQLAANGVMINTVGIGSPDGSEIMDPVTNEVKKDEKGNVVISKLNEAELQELANVSNGHYIRMDNVDDALVTITKQLDGVEKKALSDSEFINYRSFFQWFLGVGLLLLMAEYLLPARKKRSAYVLRVWMFVMLGFAAPLASVAQKENPLIRSGNRYYKKKDLDKSQQQYESAVKAAPNNPAANYNLGNVQFRKNNYADAAKSYDATVRNSQDKSIQEKGEYNKGVAMIKQQKLQESIESWKNALKLDAGDVDARENLQKALMQLKQQQQQQQKEDKEKKDKKEQQKDQKDKKEQQKDQKEQEQQQPKPQPSRLTKQQVEQLLKALQQKENDIQDKINQNKAKAPTQPEKDW